MFFYKKQIKIDIFETYIKMSLFTFIDICTGLVFYAILYLKESEFKSNYRPRSWLKNRLVV